ncbi:MAG: hypothetical protein Q9186_001681 [Xanthomendoza sp. 1 TL-2023]
MPATFIKRRLTPLRFEVLRPDPDDILCEGSDVEETLDEHEAKRRRVEKSGEEYLRGKTLYIASAQLKGPFVNGWNCTYSIGRRTREVEARSGGTGGQPPPQHDRSARVIRSRSRPRENPVDVSTYRIETPTPTHTTPPYHRKSVGEDVHVTVSTNPRQETEGIQDPFSRRAPHTAQILSQQTAAERAQVDWGQHEAKELLEASVSKAREVLDEVEGPRASPKPLKPKSKRSQRIYAIPPSTDLPEFEYRYGQRETSYSPERISFGADLEARMKKADTEQKWRLSFTASGSVRGRDPHVSSSKSRTSNLSQRSSAPRISAKEYSAELRKQSDKSVFRQDQDTTYGQTGISPEAQVVQEPAFKVPSGLSTAMLETDKLSIHPLNTGEGDSYLGLSTQAAILKAQNSFHKDLVSSTSIEMRSPLTRIQENPDLQLADDDKNGWDFVERPRPRPRLQTPGKDEEPMSTQDMMTAISPFADTTVKRRRSPTRRPASSPSSSELSSPLSQAAPNFEATTLSMSTSPSPTPTPANNDPPVPLSALSKPTSITSFSIAPNGTMTEVFQQDGQQQEEDYLMADQDLDAAIEEAGSFLGEWNLEKETRALERSTAGSKASTAKGSRSHE